MKTVALFRMLADPTRRRIPDLRAGRGPLTVGEIAGKFPDLVTSGISKHPMVRRDPGLVVAPRQGRHQSCHLGAEVLRPGLTPWLRKYERDWGSALERLRVVSEAQDDEGTA